LTRDRGLLKRSEVTHGYYLREVAPRKQVVEVLRRFDLCGAVAPFIRCLRCNGPMQPVDREAIQDRLPPRTRQYYDEFFRCAACDRVYWKGSHYRRMEQFVEGVLREARTGEW